MKNTDTWLYRISFGLVVLGLAISIYMTIYKLFPDNKMCLGSGGCNVVNASPYSEVNGVPVAVIGIFGYLSLLVVHFFETRSGYFKKNGTLLIFGFALTGFLFTAYLIYVEIVLIQALCPFCVTSQISMTLIFLLSIVRLIRQP